MDPIERTGISRRELLRRGAFGGLALAAGPALAGCSKDPAPPGAAGGPRIVIVGAGLAGLGCALRLHDRGVAASVYEARPDRVGGRCWTAREWAGGQTAEHGGEFIDSRHRRMRALASRFGLELTDLYAAANPGAGRLWLNGRLREPSELRGARREFIRRLSADAKRVGPYSAGNHSEAAVEFDRLSVADWLDANVSGGSGSALGQYVWAEMASEFGLDAPDLSALNLFYQFVENTPDADERYHVRGGNDQITEAIAADLPAGTVTMDAPLEAVFVRGDGSFGLRFASLAAEVIADRVVLALPFTTLRRVDLDDAGLSTKRRRSSMSSGWGRTPRS